VDILSFAPFGLIEFLTIVPEIINKNHAPPELELEIAKLTLLTKAPGSSPITALGPKINPKNKGLPIT